MPISRSIFAFAALTALAACGGGDDQEGSEQQSQSQERSTDTGQTADVRSLSELIDDEPRFSSLRSALEAADLMTTFDTEGPITLFAPSNEAFANLPGGLTLEELSAPSNQDLLREILAFHVVGEQLESTALVGNRGNVPTVNGADLTYDGTGSVVQVGAPPTQAFVVLPDIMVSNGVVHLIDTVMLPPSSPDN